MERIETFERSARDGRAGLVRNVSTALNGVVLAANLPERVELVPAGEVKGRDGRRWVNDNPLSILERFALQGTDLPVDIEHSTELRAPKGEPAPAAGWVHKLEVVNGAVWGAINWNESGRNLVGGRQYRYLSPVILYDPGTGSIAGLASVALTNRPNLHLQALNSGHTAPLGGPAAMNAEQKKIMEQFGNTAADLARYGQAQADGELSATNAEQKRIMELFGNTAADLAKYGK